MRRSRDELLADLRATASDLATSERGRAGGLAVPALLAEAAEMIGGDAEVASSAATLSQLWAATLLDRQGDTADAQLAECIALWHETLGRLAPGDPAELPVRLLLAQGYVARRRRMRGRHAGAAASPCLNRQADGEATEDQGAGPVEPPSDGWTLEHLLGQAAGGEPDRGVNWKPDRDEEGTKDKQLRPNGPGASPGVEELRQER